MRSRDRKTKVENANHTHAARSRSPAWKARAAITQPTIASVRTRIFCPTTNCVRAGPSSAIARATKPTAKRIGKSANPLRRAVETLISHHLRLDLFHETGGAVAADEGGQGRRQAIGDGRHV